MITTASFRNDIKHNMSREEICAKYKISEEELTHFINANYLSPNTRKFVNRMLKTNDKRNTRKTNHSRESVEVESMSCEDVETAEVVAMTDAETDHLSDVITLESLQVVTLEDLIEEENTLKTQISDQEIVAQNLIAKRRSIRTRLKEEHKKLVELQKSLNSKEIEIEDLFKQLNNINSSAEECNVYLTLLREDLLAKQKVIREMRKITVYVFSDGNIEMENLQGECPNFDASAEDCIRLFSKLTEKSKYEDLTLKQVKQFFQLKSLVDFLESQNLEFQISFESDIMKLLWEEEQE